MASSIDATKPVATIPTTSSVRANFAAAASEIEALQDGTTTITDSITAGTTQTQAGATALTTSTNRVTVSAVNGDGVKLPTAAEGLEILIINDDSAQTIQIWPNTDDTIDGGAADAVDSNTLVAGSSRRYVAADSTNWYTSISGGGDVNGPSSSTDNAIPRFDSTTGKLIQGSTVLIDDSDNITAVASLTMAGTLGVTGDITVDNLQLNGNSITSTDAAGDINLTPHTTGDLVLDGMKWPQADGSNTNVLQTNGSGQLSWVAAGSGDMTAANNLSDVASAATSFGNIKQAATTTATGVVELATGAETNTGTDTARAVTPDGLDDWTGSTQIATVGTIGTGVWQGTDVGVAYGGTGASTLTDGGILLGSGTDPITAMGVLADGSIVVGDGSTDPVALAAFSSSTGNLVAAKGGTIGQQTIWWPAGAMEPAVTTAPATSNVVEIGTSLFAARTMDFATDADDYAYFGLQMPKSWDAGTLVCQFVWSATGTTANTVLWAIAATSLGDDEVLTTAFPSPVSPAADTNSTTADDIMISAEVSVTVGSTPTAEDYVMFEVSRDVSGDTLAEDARLHGIKIHYTIDTGTDT